MWHDHKPIASMMLSDRWRLNFLLTYGCSFYQESMSTWTWSVIQMKRNDSTFDWNQNRNQTFEKLLKLESESEILGLHRPKWSVHTVYQECKSSVWLHTGCLDCAVYTATTLHRLKCTYSVPHAVCCTGSVHSSYTARIAVDLECTLHYTTGTLQFGLGGVGIRHKRF